MGRSRTTHAGRALTEKQDRVRSVDRAGVSNSRGVPDRRDQSAGPGHAGDFGRTIRNTAGRGGALSAGAYPDAAEAAASPVLVVGRSGR